MIAVKEVFDQTALAVYSNFLHFGYGISSLLTQFSRATSPDKIMKMREQLIQKENKCKTKQKKENQMSLLNKVDEMVKTQKYQ